MEENKLAIKIFATSVLLQELLDETEGKTQFKNKVRFHVNGLQRELSKLNSIEIKEQDVSLMINDSIKALEETINLNKYESDDTENQ